VARLFSLGRRGERQSNPSTRIYTVEQTNSNRKSGILPDSASRRLAGRVELEAQLPETFAHSLLPSIKDGLLKLKDFPAEIGGSGQTMPE
jgi:hypothetical protein